MGKKIQFIPILWFILSLIFLLPVFSQQEVEETLKECSQKVVTLIAYDSHKKEISRGKGVIISSDGLVLTNYHLLSQAHSAKAFISKQKIHKKVDWENVFYPGYERKKKGEDKKKLSKRKKLDVQGLVDVDKSLDLALIRIKGKGFSAAPVSQSDSFQIGNKVLIVVEEESLSEGSVTSVRNFKGKQTLCQISLPYSTQMSGS
ncbi:trypsin-like peptidase domain-containing protein, partial [bacterium]|nr:trypsin-like peptidase domain-containing protein [bacterium]